MWGTYMLDVYRESDAREMRDALEALFGPRAPTDWASAGVYVFWHPVTRDPLYVGINGDLPVRFAQHNGLRGGAKGTKRKNIKAYFADEHDELGFTVLAISDLSQPDTGRYRATLGPDARDVLDFNASVSAETMSEIRALEGRLIAHNTIRCGARPPWNTSPGRLPKTPPQADDGTMAVAVGLIDILLQARKTIRQLAADDLALILEEHLHAARFMAVAGGFVSGEGLNNNTIRRLLNMFSVTSPWRDEILRSGYLEQRNPLTIGPIAEPPPERPA